MRRDNRENPPVQSFGVGQVSSLVQFDRMPALGCERGGHVRGALPLHRATHRHAAERSSTRYPFTSLPASRRSTPFSMTSTVKPNPADSRSM